MKDYENENSILEAIYLVFFVPFFGVLILFVMIPAKIIFYSGRWICSFIEFNIENSFKK